jgi:hypothetical protein
MTPPCPKRAQSKERQQVSLYSLVNQGMAGRLGGRAESPAQGEPAPRNQVLLPGASMWILQAGIAITAIATAILIGLGR